MIVPPAEKPGNAAGRGGRTAVDVLDNGAIGCQKELAEEVDIPYQTLINAYLADCAAKRRKPALSWGE